MLKKLNNVFAGTFSHPVGVDTHIEFKKALYSPNGIKLKEPGINRIVVNNIIVENKEEPEKAVDIYKFIEETGIDWSNTEYLNIWLVSDIEDKVKDFVSSVSINCLPKYYNSGVLAEDLPKGLTLTEYTDETVLSVANKGEIYKLQELTNMGNPTQNGFNELGFYIGMYLGLLPVSNTMYQESQGNIDFCDDTINYDWTSNLYKSTSKFYFKSENLMGDNSGLHTAISKEQAIRIRWVLENCPERSPWKSDFAFTGISE